MNITTHFVYHNSGHRWAIQQDDTGRTVAALYLTGDEGRRIYKGKDADAVNSWLSNLDPDEREDELREYFVFTANHETGWM